MVHTCHILLLKQKVRRCTEPSARCPGTYFIAYSYFIHQSSTLTANPLPTQIALYPLTTRNPRRFNKPRFGAMQRIYSCASYCLLGTTEVAQISVLQSLPLHLARTRPTCFFTAHIIIQEPDPHRRLLHLLQSVATCSCSEAGVLFLGYPLCFRDGGSMHQVTVGGELLTDEGVQSEDYASARNYDSHSHLQLLCVADVPCRPVGQLP